MRLFVALDPPEHARAHLDAAVAAIRPSQPDVRWASANRWHLTLAFLGEVDETVVAPLRDRLARAASRHPPMTLAFARAGRFDGRVLWTGVEGDVEVLRRLADSVAAAARRAGIDIDGRRFRPHVTLARAREPVDLRRLVARLADYAGPQWTAASVHLVRSTLGPRPHYDDIAFWPLTGRADPPR
jgi:2'-5' RNA ligase